MGIQKLCQIGIIQFIASLVFVACTDNSQVSGDTSVVSIDAAIKPSVETGALDSGNGSDATTTNPDKGGDAFDAAVAADGNVPTGLETETSTLRDATADANVDASADATADATVGRKTGVLFLHVGSDDEYKFDWHIQFMNNLYDLFPPGQYAGGGLEGSDCYTLIHHADQAEAAICGVVETTPIDVFCNAHTANDAYPIHSLGDHLDGSFSTGCYADDAFHPLMMLWFGHTTIDPANGQAILGPHIDDPNGVGIGIADFLEMSGFALMHNLYNRPNHRDIHRFQAMKWWYGNDAQGLAPDAQELTNIKDTLAEMKPDYVFAFRHGWEAYLENTDVYGNPSVIADSAETAIRELIEVEKVDRIVVLHSYPSYANLTQYGHEWIDAEGNGVSAVPGKTFKQCVEDLDDGVGPATQEDLNAYLTHKPWDAHDDHPFPVIKRLVEAVDPTVTLRFAPGYGTFDEFGQATVEALKYTIDKYQIPRDASLQVILAHHGFYSAYMNAQACDCYTQQADQLFARTRTHFDTDFSWDGKFEIVHAPGEFAEGEYGVADVPSPSKPQGDVVSLGEQIDNSINGRWINSQGVLIDNGTDNFQYIVVLPYFFDTESSDTIFEKRVVLGNYVADDLGGFARDTRDADGTEYDEGDLDEENFTVKVLDGSGWFGVPAGASSAVGKGSTTNPTTVIVTGTVLSLGNGLARKMLTQAAAKAVLSVLEL